MPDHGARVLWQACQAKIIYAGTSEPELCQLIEDLCGYVKVRGPDEHHYTHRGELRRRPASTEIRVLPMAAIRQLPPGRAVVLQGTAPPVIVRTEQYWRRADYRAWHRNWPPAGPAGTGPARADPAGARPGGAGRASAGRPDRMAAPERRSAHRPPPSPPLRRPSQQRARRSEPGTRHGQPHPARPRAPAAAASPASTMGPGRAKDRRR